MNGPEQNDLWQKLAEEYTKQYGEQLQQEAEQLNQNQPHSITPGLDAKLQQKLAAQKPRPKPRRWLYALAACLVLALLLPSMLNWLGAGSQSPPAQIADQPATPDASEPPAEGEPDAEAQPSDPTEEVIEPPAAQPVEPLALPVALPANFSVAAQMQDRGQTVYLLEDQAQDHVVLTLAEIEQPANYGGLQPLEINGHAAYGTYGPDYSMLTFDLNGIRYELSCAYEIGTLLELGECFI